jgi:hypothetical protein
LVLRGN